jgi:hypothetical protein
MPGLARRGLELLEPIHVFPLSPVEDGAGKGRRIVVIRKDLLPAPRARPYPLKPILRKRQTP